MFTIIKKLVFFFVLVAVCPVFAMQDNKFNVKKIEAISQDVPLKKNEIKKIHSPSDGFGLFLAGCTVLSLTVMFVLACSRSKQPNV
jgi:hypothetical protein